MKSVNFKRIVAIRDGLATFLMTVVTIPSIRVHSEEEVELISAETASPTSRP
jgi:hypothetical protein